MMDRRSHAAHTDAPLHSVIRNELLDEITSGRFRPGDQIPTEPDLIERYSVSRTTVRRALRDLETSGFIVRRPGRGSFVLERPLESRLDRVTGFVEEMQALGLRPSAKVVTIERVPASPEVAAALGIQSGETTEHIERVRLANGEPISFDDSYLPQGLGSRLAEEDLEEDPIYSIFEDKFGIAVGSAEYMLSSTLADSRIAGLLAIGVGAAVMHIDRTSYSQEGQPLLFEHLHFRGDRMRYRLRLNR